MAICYLSLSHFAAMKANGLQTVAMCNAFAERDKTFLFFFDDDGSCEVALRGNFRIHENLVLSPIRTQRYPFKPRLFNLLHMTWGALRIQEPIRFVFTREIFIAFFLSFARFPFFLEHHLDLREAWHRRLLGWIGRSRYLIANVPISGSMIPSLGLERSRPDRVLVLHDGVDLSLFRGTVSKPQARAALGLPEARFIAGYCGQLYVQKGAHFILELADRMPETLFLMVGGEPGDLQLMSDTIRSMGLANVILAGKVDHSRVPEYLAACDTLLLPNPTNYYMSPLKLFEYMAACRPVIASDFPPFREVIDPGVTGLLATPKDAASFLACLQALQRDPSLGAGLAAKARAKVESEYSWNGRVDRLIQASVLAWNGTRSTGTRLPEEPTH